jgi:glycine/serine hydroxymethyltransferase
MQGLFQKRGILSMYVKEISEIENLIQKQAQWRNRCINLIASENIVSQRVRTQAGSDFAHRYAEGHPGERYYRGTSYIDEINDIIINMNMLPHEPLKAHDHPDGIRIGVQEMTRFGMGAVEMERIAELMKECIIDKRPVKEEVNRFRSEYQRVKYSYDEPQPKQLKVLEGRRLDK